MVAVNIVNVGTSYNQQPYAVVDAPVGGGTQATIELEATANIDKPMSYGDNNKFKAEARDVLFSDTNPFGEI